MSESYSGDHPDGKIPDSDSQKLTEEKKEWLRNLPSKEKRYQEPSQLPRWAKLAMAKYKIGVYDTWKEAAEDNDRAKGTLYNYRATPAGKKYLKRFDDVLDNPGKVAENLLRGELAGFTLDFVTMWEEAVDAGDYAEVRKMFETVMDRVPDGLSKSGGLESGPGQIVINLPGAADPEPVEVEPVEVEEIEPAEDD